jgi:hypothetical protein
MAIRVDPDAAGVFEAAAADVLDPAAADVFEVVAVDDPLDEHPAISTATAATATPPATMRARSSLNMVLCRSFREKGPRADQR